MKISTRQAIAVVFIGAIAFSPVMHAAKDAPALLELTTAAGQGPLFSVATPPSAAVNSSISSIQPFPATSAERIKMRECQARDDISQLAKYNCRNNSHEGTFNQCVTFFIERFCAFSLAM